MNVVYRYTHVTPVYVDLLDSVRIWSDTVLRDMRDTAPTGSGSFFLTLSYTA